MRARAVAFAAALVVCFGSAGAAQSGGFVVMLGRDTVQVERFARTAVSIEGEVVYRAPMTRLVKYRMRLGRDGRPSAYEQSILTGDGVKVEPNASNGSLTFAADTVVRDAWRGAEPVTHRLAVPAGTLPLVGASYSMPFAYSWITYELAIGAARDRAENGESRLLLMGTSAGQTAPQAMRVWLVGADSAELDYFGVARAGFKFDTDGRLLRSDWGATTYKYRVTRVASIDVGPIARAWASQDAAGRGFGVYSPRDTARGKVGGRDIWIDYSRPSKRGRTIWGSLVPWDEVWRLGADFATHLSTPAALVIGGVPVPAGTYSLWMLPSRTNPQLIVNRQSGIFGTNYNGAQDYARIPLMKSEPPVPVERLALELQDGRLRIEWDDAAYSVDVKLGVTPAGAPGSYAVTKALASNTCGHTLQPRPAQLLVAQLAPDRLELRDGVGTYVATLNTGGAFASAAVPATNPDGWQLSALLAGTFRADGVDARLTVDVKRQAEPSTCQYVVTWTGRKLGL